MRFSLYTLVLVVLLAGSVMAFVIRFPAWRMARTMRFDGPLKIVKLADDGKKIVVIADKIYVYDRYSGKELLTLDARKDESEYFTVTAISKRRDAIAFYDTQGCVSIYSLRDLKRICQTEPVSGLNDTQHSMHFSDGGEWIVVPIKPNEYNAYSLSGEKKAPLLRADEPFHIGDYFEAAGIVYRSARDNGKRMHSGEEFYSLKENRIVFEYGGPPRTGWVYWACALAPDGKALFAGDADGRIAKLDLTQGDRGPVTEDKFVLPEKEWIGKCGARLSGGTILYMLLGTPRGSDDCHFALYSMSDLKLFAHFDSKQGQSYVSECAVDDGRRRVFVSFYSKMKKDFDRFQVVDTRTGEVLFALKNPDAAVDFDPRANAVLLSDRQTITLFVRDHPEWWWGHFCRLETWLIILFTALLAHRFFSRSRRKAAV